MPIVLIRLVVWLRRKDQPAGGSIAHLRKMMNLTTVLSAVLALGLGVWGVVLVSSTSGIDRAFVPIYISLGAITCAYCLSSIPKAACLTLLLATVAPLLALLASGEPMLMIIGANLLLINGLVLKLIATQYRQLARVVGLTGHTLGR